MAESTTWAFNFLTFLNHGVFAALFLWRLAISPDGLTPDPTRALKVESETVCSMIGCDPVDVNKRSVAIIKPFFESSGLGDGAFFMFWYMTLEGCLHLGICYGSFLLLFVGYLLGCIFLGWMCLIFFPFTILSFVIFNLRNPSFLRLRNS